MKRKRKLFTGTVPIGGPSVKSRRQARIITSKFHELNNKLGNITDDIPEEERVLEKEKIMNEIERLGGRNRYQQASVVTTGHHKTSKWVVSTLQKLGAYGNGKKMKLKTLEVGAINIQLKQYSGLDVRAIDINSQHSAIEEIDFFDIPPEGLYDVIVCSMVVNCVSTPEKRGEMLARLSLHLRPKTGLLFLVLPTRCVECPFLRSGRGDIFSLLRGMNLATPTSDQFPSCVSLSDLVTRTTPKLSFFVLTHHRVTDSSSVHGSSKFKEPLELRTDSVEAWLGPTSCAAESAMRNLTALIFALKNDISPEILRYFRPDTGSTGSHSMLSNENITSTDKVVTKAPKFDFVIQIPNDIITILESYFGDRIRRP